MATKSVLKNSASALLALLLGTAALIPATASAQERVDRGERGAGRMERMERPAPPPVQAQVQAPRAPVMNAPSGGWQSRAPVMSAPSVPQSRPPVMNAPSGWQGRAPVANAPSGWQGRPAWQNGAGNREDGDRERGDRGNGVNPSGQSTFGRPAWQNNRGQVNQPPQAGDPAWGTRNQTYVDPNRGRPAEQGDRRDGRDWQNNRNNTWQGNRAENRGDRGRDRVAPYLGHDDRWSPNDNRADNRSNNRDDRWRGNNGWRGNNNNWGSNRWGYNNGGRGWDRNGWRRDNRYNWSGWRNSHRSTFSLGLYYAPWQDYSYSRFGIGAVIGAPFYSQRYWIADPWAYRLPPADGPYRWVRYYDDALLVDLYSGEVVDVIYDIFY